MPILAVAILAGVSAWWWRDALFDDARTVATPSIPSERTPASATTSVLATSVLAQVAAPHAGTRAAPLGAPTIKASPTRVLAFDGSKGRIVIDAATIEGLEAGQYVFSHYGEHIVAHRVHRKERREDHTYVAMAGVDPVDGSSTQTYGAYHLYDEGVVSHFVNHDEVAFDVHGPVGEPLDFVNLQGTPEQREQERRRIAAEEAKARAEGRVHDGH